MHETATQNDLSPHCGWVAPGEKRTEKILPTPKGLSNWWMHSWSIQYLQCFFCL